MLVPGGPIDDILSLVQVMAYRLFGTNPLPKPSSTKIYDAIGRQ